MIQPKGLTGHLRGLKHKTIPGEIVRPDLVLLDDPQDDESANSPSQCDKREKLINGAVLGLAGHKKKIAAVMPCTIICKNDLADRILDHSKNPDWNGQVCKLVYKFPDSQETLWKEYAEIRKAGILEGKGIATATEFYRENRLEMDKGSVVGWEYRKFEHELSALQHAENLLLERGESAFYSEFQNDPRQKNANTLYNLDSGIVSSRINHYPQMQIPPECHFLTAGIDINLYGLHWTVVAACNDLTCYIVDYGTTNEVWSSSNTGSLTEAQAIFNSISELCTTLATKKIYIRNNEPMRIKGMLVDCGYMTESCTRAAKSLRIPSSVLPSRGRGSKSYRQTKVIGKPGSNFHETEWTNYQSRVIIHNSDFWRMHVQKAFLLKPHGPGSISLYGKDPSAHQNFSDHVCSEVLREFHRGDTTDFYNWNKKPGHRNDWLDSLVMSVVAAGVCGASMTGGEKSWRAKPQRRRGKGNVTYYS